MRAIYKSKRHMYHFINNSTAKYSFIFLMHLICLIVELKLFDNVQIVKLCFFINVLQTAKIADYLKVNRKIN